MKKDILIHMESCCTQNPRIEKENKIIKEKLVVKITF